MTFEVLIFEKLISVNEVQVFNNANIEITDIVGNEIKLQHERMTGTVEDDYEE